MSDTTTETQDSDAGPAVGCRGELARHDAARASLEFIMIYEMKTPETRSWKNVIRRALEALDAARPYVAGEAG